MREIPEAVKGGSDQVDMTINRINIESLQLLLPDRQKVQLTPEFAGQIDALVNELVKLGLDDDTCSAAVLHLLTLDQPQEPRVVEKKLNVEVARLYQRISAMNVISGISESGSGTKNLTVENLRRMLLAMVDDVRVVLVKLSYQLILLKGAKQASEQYRNELARETLDLFAPLANRLGVWQLKWELEDLSLRYIKPDIYQSLARQLSERRADREQYIEAFIEGLSRGLQEQGIEARVYGRPKHIYSIWRKMQRKNLDFEQIYDVRAVRILVDNITDCYTALGIVHTRWPNIASEFDDYIAVPKKNG